jgi:hypothetical protein
VANASVSDGTEVKAYNWTPTDVITSVSAAVSPYVSKDMTVTCQAVAANGCLSDLKSVKIQAIPIPVPTVAVIDEATGNDVTGKVLCPGTKYHLLYTMLSLRCLVIISCFGRMGFTDGSDDNLFCGNAGQAVISDTYVMSQSLRFSYNVAAMGQVIVRVFLINRILIYPWPLFLPFL